MNVLRTYPLLLLIGAVLLVACGSPATALTSAELAAVVGDANRGETLFHQPSIGQTPGCGNCHPTTAGEQSFGPTMYGVAAVSAESEIREAILDPQAKITEGFPPMMFDGYAKHLTNQEVADLVAYIMTLKD